MSVITRTGVAAAIAATGCSYGSRSFSDADGTFPGPRVELPCLDLAVALVRSAPAPGPVIQYSFGNRCRRSITVDLSGARVTARDVSGVEVPLRPFDPRGEIRPMPLDGLMSGREQVFYLGPAPMSAISICVDVADVDRSGPATARRVCLAERTPEVRP